MNTKKIKTKYSQDDRKNIVKSIENLKNDADFVAIFDILMNDPAKDIICTKNSGGVCLNMSVANDKTLDEVDKYLCKKIKSLIRVDSSDDIHIIPTTIHTKSDRTYKLSNYEQNIIRQRELKKHLEKDTDYEDLCLSNTTYKNRNQAIHKKSKKSPTATK